MTIFKGHYDGQAVVFDEVPPYPLVIGQQVQIVVETTAGTNAAPLRKSLVGFAKGMFEMRDDFNDPLDEFAEYR